jgi:small subunit ribosomal protein S6
LPAEKKEKTYEVVYIIRPTLDEDAVDKVAATVEEYIKAQGASDVTTDKKGRRRLAYEVDKMKDGYYVLSVFTAKSSSIAQIKRMMILSEDIVKSLIVVQEKEAAPMY